jgi:Na+-driven multidrug efflux pump
MGEPRRHKELNAASAESGDTSRKLWVVAVLAFWISAGVTLAVMLTTGKLNLNLILVSITLGMMVLGVWLEARYQLRQRKARGRVSGGDSV